jgi:membrane protein DedA with SNARE-associated domain
MQYWGVLTQSQLRRALLSSAAGLAIVGSLGVAFSPSLLTYSPLLLLALSPLPRHLILVAPLVPMAPFVLITVVRRMLSSGIGYGLGLSYGQGGLTWAYANYPRLGRYLKMLERAFERAAPVVLLVWPGPLVSALAGVSRMQRRLFMPIAIAGQTAQAVLAYVIGEALVRWTAPLVSFLKDNVLEATLLCIAAVGLYRLVAVTRRRAQSMHAVFEPAVQDDPAAPQDQA